MFDFDDLDEIEAAPKGEAIQVDESLKQRIEQEAQAADKAGLLETWCTKYKFHGFPLAKGVCKFRVFCFHNAGSTESTFTGPAGNPLMDWMKASKQVEVIAPSYPGRDKTRDQPLIPDATALAEKLLAVLYSKLTDGVPFIFYGHSVGTWVTTELLMLMLKCGMEMPKAFIAANFPGPRCPEDRRPWRRNKGLNEAQMKEEVTTWERSHFEGPGAIVFQPESWKSQWEPLMRNDFSLYDEYEWKHGDTKWDFPVHAFCSEKDFKVKMEHVEMWREMSDSATVEELKDMGHLTCFYQAPKKKVYLQKVTDTIKTYTGGI